MKFGAGLQLIALFVLLLMIFSSSGSPAAELRGLMDHTYFKANQGPDDFEQVLTSDVRYNALVVMKLIERFMLKLGAVRQFLAADESVKNYENPFIPAIIILIFFRFFQNSRSTSGSDFSAAVSRN